MSSPSTTSGALLGLETLAGVPDVRSWIVVHLPSRFDGWVADVGEAADVPVLALADVIDDDAEHLRRAHRRLVDAGTPPAAAATYLADWYGGIVAGAVGEALATAGAALIVDGLEAPTDVRFHVHPDGWPCRLELPARAAVAVGHPWAGTRGATTMPDGDAVIERAVTSLVGLVTPIIDACHGLASVGRAGLWNEVGDSLGTALAHQARVPVTPAMVAVLDAAVAVAGAPWRVRPELGFADLAPGCPVHVVRKGGCCLAYTGDRPPRDADDPSFDEDLRDFLRRFPDVPGESRYCMTCSFRDRDDVVARQLFWAERRRPG